MQWMSNLTERYKAASEYVNAVHNLPPTYNTFSELGIDKYFPQIIADPVTPDQIQHALDRVDVAQQNLAALARKPL